MSQRVMKHREHAKDKERKKTERKKVPVEDTPAVESNKETKDQIPSKKQKDGSKKTKNPVKIKMKWKK